MASQLHEHSIESAHRSAESSSSSILVRAGGAAPVPSAATVSARQPNGGSTEGINASRGSVASYSQLHAAATGAAGRQTERIYSGSAAVAEAAAAVATTAPATANTALPEEDHAWREQMLEINRESVDHVLSQAEDNLARREDAIRQLRDEVRRLRGENARLRSENSDTQRRLREADGAAHDTLRAERQRHSQALFEVQQAKERAAAELATLTSELNAKFEDTRDLRERLALSEGREEQLRKTVHELEERERLHFQDDSNRIDDLRQQALKASQYAADMERRLGAVMSEKLHAREQSDRTARQVQQLQRKLTDSEQELVRLRAQISAGALVSAEHVKGIVEEKRSLQDELNAAHINNIRLLRIISESNELSRFINFNEISNEFVFCGYQLLTGYECDAACVEVAGLVRDAPAQRGGGGRHTPSGSTAAPRRGAGINVLPGKTATTFNRRLGGSGGVTRSQANELREAIDEENVFLRRKHVDVAPLFAGVGALSAAMPGPAAAAASGSASAAALGNDNDVLMHRLHSERDFWIPHSVFVAAQKFKSTVLPHAPIEAFYEFLVEVNKIWRSRMSSRVAAGKAMARAQCEAKATKSKKLCNSGEDERAADELARLRREVRQRFQCKSTLQLFQSYDSVARHAIKRRIDAEERVMTLAARLNEALATRDPSSRTLDAALAAVIANSHSMASYLNEKIVALVADMRVLMRNVAPDLAQNNLQGVARVLDEFFSEVYAVSQESVRALHRCADEAETCRARCVAAPSGSRDGLRGVHWELSRDGGAGGSEFVADDFDEDAPFQHAEDDAEEYEEDDEEEVRGSYPPATVATTAGSHRNNQRRTQVRTHYA